jgi:uncharacterized membrane protein YbhN (UPF0104 family)
LRSYAWKGLLVAGVGAGGLWTATHGVAGVAWADVGLVLRGVSVTSLVVLSGIWLLGLGIYSTVLSAALPGLGMRRGLLLNLSGSAVANAVPLGGAVATALNWRMARTWGHSDSAFVTFCVLTNALDVLTKLFLPVVGVAALVAVSVHVPAPLWAVTGSCAGVLVLVLAWQVLPGRLRGYGRARHARATSSVRRRLRASSLRVRDLFLGQWTRLLPGSLGYIAAQVALLFVSLRAVGLHAPFTTVLMAAAIERLGTLVPLTPGGTGIAEIGTIAWLLAAGLDPVEAVAGVLLYRVFLVALEIPVGGLLLGGWALLRRNNRGRRTAAVLA